MLDISLYTIFHLITDTVITGKNMKNLLLLNLEPAATNNYTCTPAEGEEGQMKNDTSIKHYVIGKAIFQ